MVSFTAVGTCVLDANQAGNTNYNAAPQVQQTFTVDKGNQTISFTSTAPRRATVGGATYTPTATATSGLTVAFTLDGTSTGCTLSGGVVSFTVRSAPAPSTPTRPATPTTTRRPRSSRRSPSTRAARRSPSPRPTPRLTTVGGATYTPTATATSGLTVAITVDGTSTGCSISGGVVSFTAAGTCTLDANQAGNANYNAAPQVQQTFTVGKGSQTITFTSTDPAPTTVGGATYTADGHGHLGSDGGLHCRRHEHRLHPERVASVTFTAVGTCTVDANQAGNANYNAATQVQQSFTVNKGSQTISFTSTTPRRDGRRRHLHPDGHGHLGPDGGLHPRRHEHRLHPERWRGQLHGGRHLRRRRQPGRQHQLQRGDPGPADLHRQQGQPDDLVHLDRPAPEPRSAAPPTPRRPRPPRA